MKTEPVNVYLPAIVGKGYATFWRFKGRYRVVKGSRASKKSTTTALNFIYRMMEYPNANLLVVRKVGRTLKDSCWNQLIWAIKRLKVESKWRWTLNPLEITYIPTGQKIFFRGLDDPLKVTSITVEHGSLCWMWIEEAYEITNSDDFDMLDESIRGSLIDDPDLFKQITLTFNPWNEKCWIKRRFFDVLVGYDASGKPIYKERVAIISDDGEILAMTTNYMINEFLDESDRRLFERMKVQNPRRYQVAGLGKWGIAEGLVFENWTEEAFSIDTIRKLPHIASVFGMDFGYTNDPSTLFCGLIDPVSKTMWVFDEMYKKGMSNEDIAKEVKEMGYAKEHITADSAEPKSIARLRDLGLFHIRAARKGKDSVNNGIDYLRDFRIIIHPCCPNFLTEIGNYCWKKDPKTNKFINEPVDDFNHLMDAMRYGCEDYVRGETFSFN